MMNQILMPIFYQKAAEICNEWSNSWSFISNRFHLEPKNCFNRDFPIFETTQNLGLDLTDVFVSKFLYPFDQPTKRVK